MVVGVDCIVGVSIDDADEGRGARIIEGHHHVIVDFADFSLDVDLEYALEFDVSALLAVFGWVK